MEIWKGKVSNLLSFLIDTKVFARLIANQYCVNIACVYSSISTYSSNWMNENQVYLHLIFYIATIIVSLYVTQDFTNVLPVECSRVFISSQIIVIKKKKLSWNSISAIAPPNALNLKLETTSSDIRKTKKWCVEFEIFAVSLNKHVSASFSARNFFYIYVIMSEINCSGFPCFM